MNEPTREPPREPPVKKLQEAYVEQLRIDSVRLVRLGFERMQRASFMDAEEDVITGELVRAMREVIESPTAPDWVERYHVAEQVRQSVAGKQGKKRPILDVVVERSGRGPRPNCGFEAKRLNKRPQHSVTKYLGDEGLRAFVDEHYYTPCGHAGMLGYVQQGALEDWSARIVNELSRRPDHYRSQASCTNWDKSPTIYAGPSQHRTCSARRLEVVHVLLKFSVDADGCLGTPASPLRRKK